MRKALVFVVAFVFVLLAVAPALAAPPAKVEICHFPGHVHPDIPGQIDFILDLDLDPEPRVRECTKLDGNVLLVHPNAVSWDDDEVRRGHVVDSEGRDD